MYILNIDFKNFYSVKEEVTLDFTCKSKEDDHYLYDGKKINKISAFFGANGSGKTNLLKALAFLNYFMLGYNPNNKQDIAYEGHALCPSEEESYFCLEYINENEKFKLRTTLAEKKVKEESLLWFNPETKKYLKIYERKVSENISKITSSRKIKIPSIAYSSTLDCYSLGSMLNSLASELNLENDFPLLFKGIDGFKHIQTNIREQGKDEDHFEALMSLSESLVDYKPVLNLIQEVVCKLDLGIDSLKLDKIQYRANKEMEEQNIIFANHVDSNGNEYSLPFFKESTGTQKILSALWRLLPIMVSGGVAVYDELDSDLHPYMMSFIIEVFMNPDINIGKGQLIFSGHTLEAMKELGRHQIYFVEKDDLCTFCYRADEIEGLRTEDNIYRKYIKGGLGGIPELDASEIDLGEIK
ncbi:AAA family ATPase [Kushneria sp. AK178]